MTAPALHTDDPCTDDAAPGEADAVDLDSVLAQQPILLFDGHCNLCHGTVRFVMKRDPRRQIHFAPLKSAVGVALRERFGIPPREEGFDSVVLIDGDRAYDRSEAALRTAAKLSAPWRWASVFRFTPRLLRDGVYRLVARFRYRIFGTSDTCPVPTPRDRELFLA